MKRIITAVLSGLLLTACNRQEVCRQDEQSIPGEVLSISGMDTLELGKTVPLLVDVATDSRYCVKRADGMIISINGTYVQVGANLICTGEQHSGCDCNGDTQIRTLIYFTPNVAGYYYFSSKPMEGTTSNDWSADSTHYRVFVQ